jgi:hypothetical protein
LKELLPLLLAGLVLLVFQLSRGGNNPLAHLWSLLPIEATPTPVLEVAGARPLELRRTAPGTIVKAVAIQCSSDQPQFIGGMAALKTTLGAAMGDPLECERSVSDQGDTHQKTTTGLAYYRKHLNVVCFTTGWDHWALIDRGLVHWVGNDVDPPPDAAVLAH